MAMRPTCDVFGTARGVKKYRLLLNELDENGIALEPGVLVVEQDLCPAGLKRLRGKIETGTTPPAERKKK